ncbi:hypothetical protein PISL3812_02106 [Talaromyces islandicus]|uniref:Uncharacterized protein n=1 Tax=Talaromyces islandicus TaxID=28573 RepID=A0A0U1LP84_TALIS|nr:hypothetical protein PISL3812_02106 [Talaromyces islandicus]
MGEINLPWPPPIWAPDTLEYRRFFNASVSGDIKTIQEALDTREININARPKWNDWEGETALHRAAANGHLEIVKLLLSHGAEVDRRDDSPVGPKSAIHIAAHNGHVSVVQELIQNGADVTTRGEMEGTLLNFVLWQKKSISDKEYEIIDLVLNQENYDIHSWLFEMGGTILHQAAEIGDLKLIRYLVDRGADCNYIMPTYDEATVLCSAVSYNRLDACRLLIELGAQVTASAFASAWSMDMVELLKPRLSQSSISTSGILIKAHKPPFIRDLLRSQIVNVNDLDLSGRSALLEACTHPGLTEKIEILLELGADVHVRGSQVGSNLVIKGDMPLHRAVAVASSRTVALLIQAEADLEARNDKDQTPLIRAASYRRNKPRTEIFDVLIKAGADVNAVDSEHNTALHHLAIQNMHVRSPQESLTVFQSLVKAGALTNLTNSQGKTCMDLFSSSASFRKTVDEVLTTV